MPHSTRDGRGLSSLPLPSRQKPQTSPSLSACGSESILFQPYTPRPESPTTDTPWPGNSHPNSRIRAYLGFDPDPIPPNFVNPERLAGLHQYPATQSSASAAPTIPSQSSSCTPPVYQQPLPAETPSHRLPFRPRSQCTPLPPPQTPCYWHSLHHPVNLDPTFPYTDDEIEQHTTRYTRPPRSHTGRVLRGNRNRSHRGRMWSSLMWENLQLCQFCGRKLCWGCGAVRGGRMMMGRRRVW
jgi:hypothetical protein